MSTLKAPTLYRTLNLDRSAINADARTVALSFSSEAPVERFFGTEVLDHSPAAVRMGRLQRAAPLLLDHNPEQQIGVIESASIANGRGEAVVRFSRSALGQEVFQDVQDGIRQNVSVGYQIHEMTQTGDKQYRATDWEPLEVSLVAIPADNSVGVGRHHDEPHEIRVLDTPKEMDMSEKVEMKEEVKPVKMEVYTDEARMSERMRVRELLTLGDKFECRELAQKAVEDGTSVVDFKGLVLETRGKAKPVVESPAIGMSDKDVREFSFVRAINSLASGKGLDLAPFEKEVSEATGQRMRKQSSGFLVPMDVMTRDLVKNTAADGGYTVATNLLAGSFIELLRNKMMVRQMGATIMGGLVGDVAIPKQTGGASAYWVSEGNAPTESKQAFGQLTMTPKTVGGYTDISRKLMLQSSIDVEAFVRNDLALILALAIDKAAINGKSANGEPTGILNTTGIGSVVGGNNGAAPSWANMVDLETQVAAANADMGSLGYLTNPKVRGKLKVTAKAGTYPTFVWENGTVNGYRAEATNQVPSDLDKGTSTGVCSAIIFGNFADLVIAEWGALDVLVDPFTGGAAGTTRVRCLQDIDLGIRHAGSFAAMVDALTA
jgi:HK97 family phage major capsid protein